MRAVKRLASSLKRRLQSHFPNQSRYLCSTPALSNHCDKGVFNIIKKCWILQKNKVQHFTCKSLNFECFSSNLTGCSWKVGDWQFEFEHPPYIYHSRVNCPWSFQGLESIISATNEDNGLLNLQELQLFLVCEYLFRKYHIHRECKLPEILNSRKTKSCLMSY